MTAKWYVYFLIDPRDNQIFYIGKGTGNRMFKHVANVKAGKEPNPIKREIIQELWDEDKEPKYQINAYFWDEKAAYAHESKLIREYEPMANGARREQDKSFLRLFCRYATTRSPEIGRELLNTFPDRLMPTEHHRRLRNAIAEVLA